MTYLIASFVGTGPSEGEYLVNRAKYEDELVEGEEGWRVVNRTLVTMVCCLFRKTMGVGVKDESNGFANRN